MTDVVSPENTSTVNSEVATSSVDSITVSPTISTSLISTITNVVDKVQIFEIVTRGLQGSAGLATSSYVPYITTIPISGHRVVSAAFDNTLAYADSSINILANSVIGITNNAGNVGDVINVQISGSMTEPSWSWVQNLPIFCSTTGLLTQTQPTSGFSLVVAVATSSITILIGVKQPIIIS
jgi:hypothetical protein